MTYTYKPGRSVEVTFGCFHPDQGDDNCCPTRDGNCSECRFCRASLNAADLIRILKNETV